MCYIIILVQRHIEKRQLIDFCLQSICSIKNYIKKMGGIECSALEGGCRNNEMIEDIEKCLNTKLKQEIYCPIDDKIEIEIIKICNNLKKE